jgi:hypothetical protein
MCMLRNGFSGIVTDAGAPHASALPKTSKQQQAPAADFPDVRNVIGALLAHDTAACACCYRAACNHTVARLHAMHGGSTRSM